ncbi:hypothetical protein Tco_1022027, partial [Tanacetum coccineum]
MEVLNLMVIRQVKAEKRFKYHWGCKELKITSLCFADDLLMLCHGDLISASVLRRGLDEFCVSSSLRPSMSKSKAFFRNVPDEVITDINLVMPFKIGVLPIKYLGVPMMSKRGESIRGMASVAWKDVCKPKSQGGLGLRVGVCGMMSLVGAILRVGRHSTGPISRLINHEVLKHANLCLMTKVSNMIDGNEWSWPIEWDGRFDVVTKIPVPRLDANVKDKTVWVDKNGKEKAFSVKEVWRAIRDDCPKVIWKGMINKADFHKRIDEALARNVYLFMHLLMLAGLELVYGDGSMGVWLVPGFLDDS